MFKKLEYPFLITGFDSCPVGVAPWFKADHDCGIYFGVWIPSFLILWVARANIAAPVWIASNGLCSVRAQPGNT